MLKTHTQKYMYLKELPIINKFSTYFAVFIYSRNFIQALTFSFIKNAFYLYDINKIFHPEIHTAVTCLAIKLICKELFTTDFISNKNIEQLLRASNHFSVKIVTH